MKFAINKDILIENLGYVVKAISTKNIIPILNGIKFEFMKIKSYKNNLFTEVEAREKRYEFFEK